MTNKPEYVDFFIKYNSLEDVLFQKIREKIETKIYIFEYFDPNGKSIMYDPWVDDLCDLIFEDLYYSDEKIKNNARRN